ncbi:MAG: hypothetical protein ABSC10_13815 [Candidatus Acidiferrales bacterium]|jgi:hypothetical protein
MKAKKQNKNTKGLRAAKKLGVQKPLSKVPYLTVSMTNATIS